MLGEIGRLVRRAEFFQIGRRGAKIGLKRVKLARDQNSN